MPKSDSFEPLIIETEGSRTQDSRRPKMAPAYFRVGNAIIQLGFVDGKRLDAVHYELLRAILRWNTSERIRRESASLRKRYLDHAQQVSKQNSDAYPYFFYIPSRRLDGSPSHVAGVVNKDRIYRYMTDLKGNKLFRSDDSRRVNRKLGLPRGSEFLVRVEGDSEFLRVSGNYCDFAFGPSDLILDASDRIYGLPGNSLLDCFFQKNLPMQYLTSKLEREVLGMEYLPFEPDLQYPLNEHMSEKDRMNLLRKWENSAVFSGSNLVELQKSLQDLNGPAIDQLRTAELRRAPDAMFLVAGKLSAYHAAATFFVRQLSLQTTVVDAGYIKNFQASLLSSLVHAFLFFEPLTRQSDASSGQTLISAVLLEFSGILEQQPKISSDVIQELLFGSEAGCKSRLMDTLEQRIPVGFAPQGREKILIITQYLNQLRRDLTSVEQPVG